MARGDVKTSSDRGFLVGQEREAQGGDSKALQAETVALEAEKEAAKLEETKDLAAASDF